jgi:hypothetical protein
MTTWLRRVISGFQALARCRRDDRDLVDELEQYLEAAVEAKVASGLSRTQAVRTARAEIGSRAALGDYVRDVGWESWVASTWS